VRLTLKDETALVVPVTAIRTGGNGDFVYVIKDDRTVAQRTVIRGMSTVDWVTITSGLKEGERIVTEGADRLKDGASVQLQGETPSMGGAGGHGGRGRRGQAGDAAAAGAAAPSGAAPAQPAAAPAPSPASAPATTPAAAPAAAGAAH